MDEPGMCLQGVEALVDASADGARYGEAAMVPVHVPLDADLRLVRLVADGAVIVKSVQVLRSKVLHHVRHVPRDKVAQLTGVLGLAMIHHHVDLQLVWRHESLVAQFAHVLVYLHVLHQAPLRSTGKRTSTAGVVEPQ